jgi:hypothetical protein
MFLSLRTLQSSSPHSWLCLPQLQRTNATPPNSSLVAGKTSQDGLMVSLSPSVFPHLSFLIHSLALSSMDYRWFRHLCSHLRRGIERFDSRPLRDSQCNLLCRHPRLAMYHCDCRLHGNRYRIPSRVSIWTTNGKYLRAQVGETWNTGNLESHICHPICYGDEYHFILQSTDVGIQSRQCLADVKVP